MAQLNAQARRIMRTAGTAAYDSMNPEDRARYDARVDRAYRAINRYRSNIANSFGGAISNEQYRTPVARSVYMGLASAMGSRG